MRFIIGIAERFVRFCILKPIYGADYDEMKDEVQGPQI